ncbi:MAG: 50S ribosomal protein L30 [Myxococcota bacterium]|nr:50S ribosomal protein L30 [Myxococcota bacterium]
MADQIQVKLVRSRSKANGHQRKILDGLGLKKREQVKQLEDTASVRGMIAKVTHLVEVLGD